MSDHPLGPAAGFCIRNVPADPFTSLRYISAAIPVSDPDYFEPARGMSEADRLVVDQQRADRLNREAAQREKYAALKDASSGGVLHAVYELHVPVEQYGDWFQCGSCYDGGNMGDHEDWPCPTARVLLGEQL